MENSTSLEAKLEEQAKKIDAIYASVEKTRKYFLMMLWITAIAIVLPLLGLVTIIPSFLNSYMQSISG